MTARFEIVLSEQAIEDIISIGRWIAEEADRETANAYVSRIEAFCFKFGDFPRRGTPRVILQKVFALYLLNDA